MLDYFLVLLFCLVEELSLRENHVLSAFLITSDIVVDRKCQLGHFTTLTSIEMHLNCIWHELFY